MKITSSPPTTIDEYIAGFPPAIQAMLEKLRSTIRAAAPQALERISYRIPTFYLEGNLVHFAAFKNHVSFFPTASGVAQFKDQLSRYQLAKGTIQFPLDEPIPIGLIKKIVKFRLEENRLRAEAKLNGSSKSKRIKGSSRAAK